VETEHYDEIHRLSTAEAERALLKSIISRGREGLERARRIVRVEDFALVVHREFFSVLLEMDELGLPFTRSSITEFLKRPRSTCQ